MKIVADKAIPCIREQFTGLGELMLLDGREIAPAHLADADALVVRTVTRVDSKLLQGSRVSFVASATSGHDHVDTDYLAERGIGFAHAPGCNARAVAEYVLSALCVLAGERGLKLGDLSAGIIGCGNVGKAVMEYLGVAGIRCLGNDPPLGSLGAAGRYHALGEIQGCDIVSLHVPLTDGGDWPTRRLVDAAFLARLKPGVIFINASRGGVVDEAALARFTESMPAAAIVLDVWENEPDIDTALAARVDIATPHIAGYSLDARIRCTHAVYKQVCRHFKKSYNEHPAPIAGRTIDLTGIPPDADLTKAAVLSSYDVRTDHARLHAVLRLDARERGAFFAWLRNDYPVRREFSATTLRLPADTAPAARDVLGRLGFQGVSEG